MEYGIKTSVGPNVSTTPTAGFHGIIGASPQMRRVFAQVEKVAPTDATVLILGESGVGKEMIARAIHRLSGRGPGAFVPINCGGIPEALLESELFGYEEGAFTGATNLKQGLLETAHQGSVFLDEVGEMPVAFQFKLIRYLQDQRVYRVGGHEPIVANARVIAATNKDLEKEAEAGNFRWDLFYRLSVIPIVIPPLRERVSDIPLLANAFLERFLSEGLGSRVEGFSKEAIQAMESFRWPGNVRELENRVKRAVIMGDEPLISVATLGLDRRSDTTPPVKAPSFATKNLKEARQAVERQMVEEALERNNRKISRAASELGVSRPTLYEMIEKYNIPRG